MENKYIIVLEDGTHTIIETADAKDAIIQYATWVAAEEIVLKALNLMETIEDCVMLFNQTKHIPSKKIRNIYVGDFVYLSD